jgi:hypothetical protein
MNIRHQPPWHGVPRPDAILAAARADWAARLPGADEEEDDHRHDGGCTWAGCGPWTDDGPDTLRELRESS